MADHDVFRVKVGVENLSLSDVGDLAHAKGIGGAAKGGWGVDITRLHRALIAARGTLAANDVVASGFTAREMTAQMNLRNGLLRIDPIKFSQGEKGTATATVEALLANIQQPTVTVNAEAWPIELSKT